MEIAIVILLCLNLCAMSAFIGISVSSNFYNSAPIKDTEEEIPEMSAAEIKEFLEADQESVNTMLNALAELNNFMTGEEVQSAEQQNF